MIIKFKFKNNYYSVCIGYKSKWFSQIAFFSVTREFFDENGKVCFAESVFSI